MNYHPSLSHANLKLPMRRESEETPEVASAGGRRSRQYGYVFAFFLSRCLCGTSGTGMVPAHVPHKMQDAEIYHQLSTALGPHPLLSEALAPPVVSRNSLTASDSARPHRPPAVAPVPLTLDACSRLKDHSDDAALATLPVVRVLVLRPIGSPNGSSAIKSYEAFVTDGQEYMWLELAASASQSFGDRDDCRSVQVGSAVRLNTMSRLSGGALWYLYFPMLRVRGGNSVFPPA